LLGFDSRAARYTWTAVCIVLLIGLVYLIRKTLLIFVIALLFAYLLSPLVKFLDRRLPGRPRVIALAIVYVALVGILAIVATTIGSKVVQQADALAARLPDLISRFRAPSESPDISSSPLSKSAILAKAREELAQHSKELLALVGNVSLGIIKRVGNIIFVILIPILSFFFLKDGKEMYDGVLSLWAQGTHRDTAEKIADDVHVLLAKYMRALVLLGVVAFVTYGVFFTVLGVPYGILLAAIDFPLEFIPLVGPLTGASIVLLVAGISGSPHLLAVFLFLVAFRFFQDYIVSPHLLSAGMKLHPALVIFGVLAGGSIAGVAGSFLSVPIMAILRIVYRNLVSNSRVVVAPDGSATQ
jgi:predicted PurR-regulated permease PerM